MARILVVEDDAGQLEVRRLILEQSGHEVVTAQTAAEALDRLPGCQVVLMDLQLPTPEDGMKLIRAASGAARIVVLSGGEHQNMPPVDAFLTKPCSSRKLLETIARFCLLLICFSVLYAATVKASHPQSEVVAKLDLRAPEYRLESGRGRSGPRNDHALLREGIAALVNAESDMKLVAEAFNDRTLSKSSDCPGCM